MTSLSKNKCEFQDAFSRHIHMPVRLRRTPMKIQTEFAEWSKFKCLILNKKYKYL